MAVTEPLHRCARYRCWDVQLLPGGQDLTRWRQEAAGAVGEWGFDERVTDDVVLGVSELLANVLRHARDPRCVLELREVGAAVFVRVTDRCPQLPVIREPDDGTATSGRGLWMLKNTATALDWFSHPSAGKTVWFQVNAEHPDCLGASPAHAPTPVFRVESVACLRQPTNDGTRLMALGDWCADDPMIALGRLIARAGQVALDLEDLDPPAALALHEWITTVAGSPGTLERLRRGAWVSCTAEGSEALYEFLIRPVPVPLTTTAPAPAPAPAPAKAVASCV